MAKAKFIVPELPCVDLSLTRSEAQVLQDILQYIGGDPKTSRRGLADSVSKALTEIGVVASDLPDMVGGVRFANTFKEIV